MPTIDDTGTSYAAVALLVAVVFIGICIGIVALQATSILDTISPAESISIENNSSQVNITVDKMGNYDKIEIQLDSKTKTITETGRYSMTKASENATITIIGIVGGTETILREERV